MTRPHPFARLLIAALALLAAWALAACVDAESLGDEPATEVAVGSPPTWDNGIGTLMQLKCGVCHQVPAPPISPATLPLTFDLNYHTASPSDVPGATHATVLQRIGQGILGGPVGGLRQMPLDYATPLSATERAALETWAADGGP